MKKLHFKYATVLISFKRKEDTGLKVELISRIFTWDKEIFTFKDIKAIELLVATKDFLEANNYKEEDFEVFTVSLQGISDLGCMTEEEFHADN